MIIYVIISFLLEGVISNYVNNTILNCCFSIISLLLIYPYMYKNLNKYYILSFSLGLLYDITYTNTIFLNAIIFLIIAFIIIKLDKIISNTFINSVFIGIITIIVYRLITYLTYIIIGELSFDIMILFNSIISTLLLNIIYIMISYKVLEYVSKKSNIQKI